MCPYVNIGYILKRINVYILKRGLDLMIFLGVETSGLDPKKHGILSLGAIDFKNPTNQFYEECKIEDFKEIDPKALEVNGFDIKDIKNSDKKEFKGILEDFNSWVNGMENITLVGHNIAGFDCLFLKEVVEK